MPGRKGKDELIAGERVHGEAQESPRKSSTRLSDANFQRMAQVVDHVHRRKKYVNPGALLL
jgi:hypothetical protein